VASLETFGYTLIYHTPGECWCVSWFNPFCSRVFVSIKKSTDKSADKPENEKAIIVDIAEEETPQNTDKSTNEEYTSKEASNDGSLNKETSEKESEVLAESVVNNESCSCKSNEILELTAWLRDNQCPLSDQQLNELCVELDDFKQALKCVQPSSKREGFATVPDVTWDDVGSLRDIREELQLTILVSISTSSHCIWSVCEIDTHSYWFV
jgi:SpoVK/Ycf46/Vps4 family AAA+-type ATPase